MCFGIYSVRVMMYFLFVNILQVKVFLIQLNAISIIIRIARFVYILKDSIKNNKI